jgi:hypothetical protein
MLSILILLFTSLIYVINIELKTNEVMTIMLQPFCAELCITLRVRNHPFFLSKITNSTILIRLLPDWYTAQQRNRLYSWSGGRDDILSTRVERRIINTEAKSTWNSLFNFPKGNQVIVIYNADLTTLYVVSRQVKQNSLFYVIQQIERNGSCLKHKPDQNLCPPVYVLSLFLYSLIQHQEVWHGLN